MTNDINLNPEVDGYIGLAPGPPGLAEYSYAHNAEKLLGPTHVYKWHANQNHAVSGSHFNVGNLLLNESMPSNASEYMHATVKLSEMWKQINVTKDTAVMPHTQVYHYTVPMGPQIKFPEFAGIRLYSLNYYNNMKKNGNFSTIGNTATFNLMHTGMDLGYTFVKYLEDQFMLNVCGFYSKTEIGKLAFRMCMT